MLELGWKIKLFYLLFWFYIVLISVPTGLERIVFMRTRWGMRPQNEGTWEETKRRRVSGRTVKALSSFLFRLKKWQKKTVLGRYHLVKSTWKKSCPWASCREMMFTHWQSSYSIFGSDASHRKWTCKCSSPWKPRLGEKTSRWREEVSLRKSNGSVSVTPIGPFHEGFSRDL